LLEELDIGEGRINKEMEDKIKVLLESYSIY